MNVHDPAPETEIRESDSSEAESDMEADETSTKEVCNIEDKLLQNPYHYQSHIDLISLLRKLGELHELRIARDRMAKLFPLTQILWMEWIEDEKKIAESEQEHDHLEKLFELAVEDYMCPEIWLEYSQYATRWMNKPDGLKKIRDVLERAVAAVGQHVTEGSCVWDMYREFENVILLNMQPSPGQIMTPEQSDKIKKQKEKILGLFRGQLGVPLMGMDKTYEEYLSWCEGGADPSIRHSYNQALKKLRALTPIEDSLLAAEQPKLEEYQSYINQELKSGSCNVQCLFERALVDNCLNSELWLQYLKYMREQSHPPEVLVKINLRSVRNCPWIGQLWVLYLEALERSKSPKEKLDEAFQEALKAGFSTAYEYTQLWLTRCSQIRRMVSTGASSQDELSECFKAATNYLTETLMPAFKECGDPNFSLWTFWSHCEASVCGNVTKAENILKSLTQSNAEARRKLNVWKDYFDVLRIFGGEDKIDKCRGILRQAVQHCAILPDPNSGGIPDAETACQILIAFERQYGTILDMDESMKKVNMKLSRIAKHREKETAAYVEEGSHKKNSKQKHQVNKKNMQRKRKSPDIQQEQFSAGRPAKQQKVVEDISNNDGFKTPGLPIRYVSKSARQASQSSETPSQSVDATHSHPSPEKSRARCPPPGFKGHVPDNTRSSSDENNNSAVALERDQQCDVLESNTGGTDAVDKQSIFVSNLDFKLDSAEEKLRNAFCGCGNIVDVRLANNNKGQFRGFCYIQFSDENAAKKALELDRTIMEGRPMFVSPNVDKKKQPNFKVFKYDSGLEKHKLFVSNISFHTTEDTLRKRFSEHGSLKQVRIVTNRKGHSKGLAYIEYEKQSDASQAVMKMDGETIDEFPVKVAISNPPSRRTGQQERGKFEASRTEQFKGSRGRGRTQLSMMVPRSIGRSDQSETAKPSAFAMKAASGGMTNKDFADLLRK